MRIGATGHQRLPAQAEQFVLDDLARYAGLCDLWCVSSLAAGADQLAAARLLHLGARLHVVVPCEGYESTFTEGRSRRRYGDLVSAATVVDTLAYSQPGEDAFLAAGMAVVDLSARRSSPSGTGCPPAAAAARQTSSLTLGRRVPRYGSSGPQGPLGTDPAQM